MGIDTIEVGRKIGYWQYALSKIEKQMYKVQSERTEIKNRLEHLQHLRKETAA